MKRTLEQTRKLIRMVGRSGCIRSKSYKRRPHFVDYDQLRRVEIIGR